MNELLKCSGVVKRYGRLTALNGIDLTLEKGKIVGLLGPNGSGKTTLIKLVTGLLQPDEGTITVLGDPVGVLSKPHVAYLPDSPFLNGWMTVKQIVGYFEDFFPDFRPETAYRLLNDLGIDPGRKLKTLSKGNREKVCLILTMSRSAALYVLDEPIAGVDPATRDYIIRTILENYDPEAAVLISTHLISDIEQILEDVVFLKEGQIMLHESVDELRSRTGHSVDEEFREVFKWQ